MKKSSKIILLICILFTVNTRADDPNFDSITRIVTFPRVTVDNEKAYINVELLLNQDGTWDILSADPEQSLTLTGKWSGSLIGLALPDFIPGLQCKSPVFEVSFIQNDSVLTGDVKFSRDCDDHVEKDMNGLVNGKIMGSVNNLLIKFDIILNNDTFSFSGNISKGFRIITGDYSYLPLQETGTWKLSFQNQ